MHDPIDSQILQINIHSRRRTKYYVYYKAE